MRRGLADNFRKAKVLDAVEAVFGPLAQLLVTHGVSSPEAEALLRAVYVREAVATDAHHRKKPNASRVGLVTGVDRAEVARILKGSGKADPSLETRGHPVNRVLTGWYTDDDFTDGKKRPLLLQVKAGEQKRPTFWTLARRYAPGVYPGLILSELVRVGAVARLLDGRIKVRLRRYRADQFSDECLKELGLRVRGLLQTMINNAMQADWPRVCRAVETLNIDPKFLPLIRKMFADRSEALLSGVREELKSSRWRGTGPAGRRVRIGLAVFSYEEEPEERTANENQIAKRTYALPKQRLKVRGHKSVR